MSRIVGIDLGTTNSLIALIEKGRPRLFTGKDGSTLIPSVVTFPEGGKPVVGHEARKKKDDPRHTLFSAKRFLGRGLKDTAQARDSFPFDFSPSTEETIRFQVGSRSISPVEVSALVLGELKNQAEGQLGEKIERAVVTVPAYFDDAQRQATKLAGQIAGLDIVRIVNEPTAACLAYGLDKKAAGLIAVFDLGGGTFDISILRVLDGVFEVLATSGDTSLGGDDFDYAIAQALAVEFEKAHGKNPLSSLCTRAELLIAAEKLKIQLSNADQIEFSAVIGATPFSRIVTLAELKKWVEPVLARVEAPVKSCLKDSGVPIEKISDVILVGGSTRMPAVRERVQALFRRAPICSINPDEVVAMGAAVQANILSGQGGGMLLLDVIPLSLGIETMGGVVSKIIHRNSTIPVSASENYSTYVDGQVSVDIHVLQGERELAKDSRSLARFQLKGLPPLPAGVPKIEVEFIVDANGILSVRATELRTGTVASVEVNPSYGLNDTEVEKMLMDSFENAETDFETRFLIETRTEAESVLRSVRKSLAHGSHLVDANELTEIQGAIGALESALAGTDRTLLKAKLDQLEVTTRGLAERLLNEAVTHALRDHKLENTP